MSGTRSGGLKAAATNKERYGRDFFRTIGQLGGKKSLGGGFAKDPELARRAGRIGGSRLRTPESNRNQSERHKQWWAEHRTEELQRRAERKQSASTKTGWWDA